MCQHLLRGEDSLNLSYLAELLSRHHCWGSKTMAKGSTVPRRTKTGQQSCKTKFFGLTNQISKSFGQIGRFACGEELVKELPSHELHQTLRLVKALLWRRGLLPIAKSEICIRYRANWIRPATTSILRHHMILFTQTLRSGRIWHKNNWISTFPKRISAMWNAISLVQDLNSCRRVYFLRR